MRRRAPRSLAFALERVTGRLEPATTLARVQGCWADAAGEALARVSRPVSERDGVVTVSCEDSMWANELQMLGPDLIEKVNAALPDRHVEELRFRAGDHRARV
jgi:predicted nucleic acid-binding Zn ribbon protein